MVRKLLDWAGELVDRAIIDESDSPAALTVSWRDHVRGAGSARGRDAADRLLENLAKQTSLRFRREQRKVGVCFVVRDEPWRRWWTNLFIDGVGRGGAPLPLHAPGLPREPRASIGCGPQPGD